MDKHENVFFSYLFLIDYKDINTCEESIKLELKKQNFELTIPCIQAEVKLRIQKIDFFFIILPIAVLFAPLLIGLTHLLLVENTSQTTGMIALVIINLLVFILLYQTFFKKAIDAKKVLIHVEQKLVNTEYEEQKKIKHGQAILVLLDQLIRKESKVPYWIDVAASISKSIEEMYNINYQSISKKKADYSSINNLRIRTEQQKTTHINYIEILLSIYNASGDNVLSKRASELQSHISNLEIKK
jgi:membrane protein implicated in regulation of membrane protease activity